VNHAGKKPFGQILSIGAAERDPACEGVVVARRHLGQNGVIVFDMTGEAVRAGPAPAPTVAVKMGADDEFAIGAVELVPFKPVGRTPGQTVRGTV